MKQYFSCVVVILVIVTGGCSSSGGDDLVGDNSGDSGEDNTTPGGDNTPIVRTTPPNQITGWSEFEPVTSDGSHNETDTGSRIMYVDDAAGDDASGVYYWWNGSQIVDANGNTYGDDPMNPDSAISPFATWSGSGAWSRGGDWDGRVYSGTGKYPDWILFRRGQDHTITATQQVGRSPTEPALFGAYGDLADERPRLIGNLSWCNCGEPNTVFMAMVSLDIESQSGVSISAELPDEPPNNPPDYPADSPFYLNPELMRSWYWFEDVLIENMSYGFSFSGIADVTIYRSIVANGFGGGNNQAVFVSGNRLNLQVEESIFYRNGYYSDPNTDGVNAARDIYSRNFYIGGGARMGTTLRNIISAVGGSGGPQMRFGGLVEDSLIIEGYWFASTDSNGDSPSWLYDSGTGDQGTTYEIRNNVQLVYTLPGQAQPGSGFSAARASQGFFEDNIISGAMLVEMGYDNFSQQDSGIQVLAEYEDADNDSGTTRLFLGDNVVQNNIMYRVSGLLANGGFNNGLDIDTCWASAGITQFTNNQWYDSGAASGLLSNAGSLSNHLTLNGNTFYTDRPDQAFQGGTLAAWDYGSVDNGGNTVQARSAADAVWPAPDRTLKTYAEDVLGLTINSDNGVEEFFDHAITMRRGYWEQEYTAKAVVNYIREGFNMAPVP